MARADGAFRKPEKEVACEYLKQLTVDDRLTLDSVNYISSVKIAYPALISIFKEERPSHKREGLQHIFQEAFWGDAMQALIPCHHSCNILFWSGDCLQIKLFNQDACHSRRQEAW